MIMARLPGRGSAPFYVSVLVGGACIALTLWVGRPVTVDQTAI
jgi:hypothetical protein